MKVPMSLFQGNGLFSLAVLAVALAGSNTRRTGKVEVDTKGLFSSSGRLEPTLAWMNYNISCMQIRPHYLFAPFITHFPGVCLT